MKQTECEVYKDSTKEETNEVPMQPVEKKEE